MTLGRRAASGGPNEVWSYGETAYAIIAKLLVLRASGTELDPEAFLSESELEATATYRKGEPRLGLASRPDAPEWLSSGFHVTVSDADFDDLPAQIRDALRFVSRHEEELRRLGRFDGVETVCLDFAIDRRDVSVQSAVFDAELLWRIGALDIDLVVSHYDVR